MSENQNTNTKTEKFRQYDLEERTLKFARAVIAFVRKLPKDVVNNEIIKQLVRSSGSVGANYIEANEALSRKDFLMHIKISRKEAKESRYWLNLIETDNEKIEKEKQILCDEATQLMKIFGSIVEKTQ
jgi:four helix bundle protein